MAWDSDYWDNDDDNFPLINMSDSWHSNAPTGKQLSYLHALGYRGKWPETRGEAHAIIAQLVDGGRKPLLTTRSIRLRS